MNSKVMEYLFKVFLKWFLYGLIIGGVFSLVLALVVQVIIINIFNLPVPILFTLSISVMVGLLGVCFNIFSLED